MKPIYQDREQKLDRAPMRAMIVVHLAVVAALGWFMLSLWQTVRDERAERAACDRCPMCVGKGYIPKLPEVIQ